MLQEERLRQALERSMVEQHSPSRGQRRSPQARRRSPLPAAREDSDPELRRALQQSLEDERMRRRVACMSLSHVNVCLRQLEVHCNLELHSAVQPSLEEEHCMR